MIYTIIWFDSDDFIAFTEKVNLLKEGEKLTIFVDSSWGNITTRDSYIHVINSLPNVEMVWMVLYSAAFSLFEKVNCKKALIESAYWMVHHEAWSTDIGYEWVPRWEFAKFQLAFKKDSKPPEMKWMTKKEKKLFDKGGDVYLSRKRLRDIFSI